MDDVHTLVQFINTKVPKTILYIVFALVVSGLIWGFSMFLPEAVDWEGAFRPAALRLLSGQSPYEVDGFYNPFWALIPLIPIVVFPEQISRALLFVYTLLSFALTARKLGGNWISVVLILMSPPALHGMLNGNIDFLMILGLVFPHWLGMFFITIKPQIGIAIGIFWVVEAFREGGWLQVTRLLWPITIVFLLSIVIFGWWPLRSVVEIELWWNASLWPISIPIGLALMTAALRKRNISFAMSASPCLAPYVLFHSWIIALFAIVKLLPEMVVVFISLWVLIIFRAFG